MGWLFTAFFIIWYFVNRDPASIIAAALFAVAGELSFVRVDIEKYFGRIMGFLELNRNK